MEEYPKIIFKKSDAIFIKNEKNNLTLFFSIENKNLILPKIIDFDLIKVIYDLNGDIYENVNMERIDDNEVILKVLFKHILEDYGLPQIYSYLNIKKVINNDNINFTSKSIINKKPENIPEEAKLFNLNYMIIKCNIIDIHNVSFECNLSINEDIKMPSFVEKIIGNILYKILSKMKIFIEQKF